MSIILAWTLPFLQRHDQLTLQTIMFTVILTVFIGLLVYSADSVAECVE